MRPTNIVLSVLLSCSFLTACGSLAPEYRHPELNAPAKYKEGEELEGRWQLSAKNPGNADASAWWTVFNDAKLNQLEQLAVKENNSLKSAAARLKQARAALRQTTAGFYPQVNATANASRADQGRDFSPTTNFSVGANVSYDANTLVQISDAAAGSRANVLANESLYRQALLMVQADVAENYFAILSLDAERDLLRKTTDLRLESQNLIERRFKEGEAGEQDFLRAKAEAASTQAELKALDRERALREHALAVLVGTIPADFALEEAALPSSLPRIPAGLPSHLLERRPDVAAAEQRMIQTNAQIGIARAAFFPSIALTASGGLAAGDLGDVFSWSSKSWALGPIFGTALSLPVFDMGKRVAGVDLAKARYEESVSSYREQVLIAFKDVEDNLAALRLQADQAERLYEAAEAATKASRISDLRYKEGETSYLEVLDTQRDALSVQRSYTQIQGARFGSTVNLIRALGGGWVNVASVEPVSKTEPEPKVEAGTKSEAKPETATVPKNEMVEKKSEAPKVEQPVVEKEKTVKPQSLTEEAPQALPQAPSKPVEAPQPVQQQAPAPASTAHDFGDIDPSILFD